MEKVRADSPMGRNGTSSDEEMTPRTGTPREVAKKPAEKPTARIWPRAVSCRRRAALARPVTTVKLRPRSSRCWARRAVPTDATRAQPTTAPTPKLAGKVEMDSYST